MLSNLLTLVIKKKIRLKQAFIRSGVYVYLHFHEGLLYTYIVSSLAERL